MPASERQSFLAIAQIAQGLAQCCDLINGSGSWSRGVGFLWDRLKPLTRCIWCHAACLPGHRCLLDWQALSLEDRAALLVALENMQDFFEEVGA